MIEVFLSKALICFSGMCYPALVGETTPTGEFNLIQRYVNSEGYGGDVLKFKQDGNDVYSIHRVWEGLPTEKRRHRLYLDYQYRTTVSNGCINVDEHVYDLLLEEVYDGNSELIIR